MDIKEENIYIKEKEGKKTKDVNYSKKNSKEEKEYQSTQILPKKTGKELYESYKRDLGISEFTMRRAIKSVGEWVVNVETQRNLQMKNDFDEEKEFKLEKQKEIQNQIEELSNDNESERMIIYFNEKIQQQEILLEKYTEIKNKIDTKIKSIKDILPNLEKKVNKYKIDLRKLNRENLKLMEQINKFENELSFKLSEELDSYDYNINNNINNNMNNNNINNINNENQMNLIQNYSSDITNNNSLSTNVNNNSQSINGLNYSNLINNINFANMVNKNSNLNKSESYINNYSIDFNNINIPDILEKNESLRAKKEKNDKLRDILKEKKMENDYLMRNINQMNNNFFKCKKVYNEGMHEIAKELLRINEIELDKVINNSNTNFNSLYFDIFKSNYNSGQSKNDLLKLPLINNNIKKKFKYPILEKSEPNDLLYKVIKNIIEENNINNKINNLKKNRFSWEEFKDFSPYQIYTLLNINKEVLNKLDMCIFPNQIYEKVEEY